MYKGEHFLIFVIKHNIFTCKFNSTKILNRKHEDRGDGAVG